MKAPSPSPRQYVAGRRMMKIKEAMDSYVVKIAEGAAELYVPKVDDMETWAAVEEARKLARPMVTAVPAEKDKQVFHERPRSKVKISTPLDSDAEEEESLSTPDSSEGSDSSEPAAAGWEKKQDEEAMEQWTLETAAESFQELLNSFKFDQRVDTLEELQKGFSRRVESNEKLNTEMDALEVLLRQDWVQLEQEVADSRVFLEQHELQMFQALQRYFRCLDKYVSAPGSRQKALQELRESIRSTGGQLSSLGQPSDVLEVVQSMVDEIKHLRHVLDLESSRHDAYDHALKKMSLAALVGDDSVLQDPVTAQVVKEIRRWEIDGGIEEWVAQQTAALGKNEYAARVTRVKAEIEELKRRLERYNNRKQRKRRLSLTKQGETADEWQPATFQNVALFDDSVEWKFQRELEEIRKAQKKHEEHLAKFEGLTSLIRYQEPDLDESFNKIMEVTSRATMLRLTRRIERLPTPLTAEEQEVENFMLIRQAAGEEDEREHRDNLKRLQSEKELMQKQADEQEQKQMQVQRAIRHEQRLQDGLQAEIDEAKAMIESLEDNVNLVVARETMRQAEDARSANAEKENVLLEQSKAREQKEAQLAQASSLLEEAKALTRHLLRQRATDLESDSEPSADELHDDLSNVSSATSRSSRGSEMGRRSSAVTLQVLERLQEASNSKEAPRNLGKSPTSQTSSSPTSPTPRSLAFDLRTQTPQRGDKNAQSPSGPSAARSKPDIDVARARRQSISKGAAAMANILGRADETPSHSNSMRGGDMPAFDNSPVHSSPSIQTSRSGRRISTLNAFGMAARRASATSGNTELGRRLFGQRASLLAVGGFMKASDTSHPTFPTSNSEWAAEDSPESSKDSPKQSTSWRGDSSQPLETVQRKERRRMTMFNSLSAAAKAQAKDAKGRAGGDAELELGVSNSFRASPSGEDLDPPLESSQSLRTSKSGRRSSALNTFAMAARRASATSGDTELGRRLSGQRASLLAVSGFMKASDSKSKPDWGAEDSPESSKDSPMHSKSLKGDSSQLGQPLEIVQRKERRRMTMFHALSAAAKAQAKARSGGDAELDLGVSNSFRASPSGEDLDAPPESSQSLRTSKSGRRSSALETFGKRASLLAVDSFLKARAHRSPSPAEIPEVPRSSRSLRETLG